MQTPRTPSSPGTQQRGATLPDLVQLMDTLLAEDGCPWDREQTLASLRPFLVEEAYEVLEAIDENDAAHHRDELGDLLFQIVFQSALRAREGAFGIDDVVAAIVGKMTFRHPHVFGDERVSDAAEVLVNWDKLKVAERAARGEVPKQASVLDGVPLALPALLRAQRIGEKAAKVGFDWPDAAGVIAKIKEELVEIEEAVAEGDPAHIEHEVGDLLLAASRLAAKLGVAPEDALRKATRRFETRFSVIETQLAADGRTPAASTLEEMDQIWERAKAEEKLRALKK
ncbi:MAG: nucleoside triphosphate pyrophosphohydrolase [Polyangia bacterium]